MNATDPSGLFRIPGTNICIDIADPNCVTAIEGQPNDIADLAAGVLSVNRITAATNALGLTDTSRYADTCSGWYTAGKWGMTAVDLAIPVHAGGKVLANGNNFLRIGRGHISIGPARNHWNRMSDIGQRIFRHHIHVERRYGGIDNWVRNTNRTWWKNG